MRNAIFYPADCNPRGPMAPNWKTHKDLFNWCINCTGFRGRHFIDRNAISSELKHFCRRYEFWVKCRYTKSLEGLLASVILKFNNFSKNWYFWRVCFCYTWWRPKFSNTLKKSRLQESPFSFSETFSFSSGPLGPEVTHGPLMDYFSGLCHGKCSRRWIWRILDIRK